MASYFTLIFCPGRRLLPLMPLSFRSLATVVWLRRAMWLSVSPLRTVTALPLLFDFVRLAVGRAGFTTSGTMTVLRRVSSSSAR